jgi:DNA ligase-associated metallophosphoesterase
MPHSRSPNNSLERPVARLNVRSTAGATPGVLTFIVVDCALEPQSCGALWWADKRLLVVSDLHLEKGSAYASRGQMLPPYDTRSTLGRVARLMDRLQPRTVISLGDSFHDRRSRPRMATDDVAQVRAMTSACDWVWIEGNHDLAPPDDLGGRAASEISVGPLTFRHEPTEGPARGEVAGHLHPCARIVGRRGSVRTRCFATDGTRLVMPAYGALTGGLNVMDAAFDSVFPNGLLVGVLGREGVYAAGRDQLGPDVGRAAS